MSISTMFMGGFGSGGNLAIHSTLLWNDRIAPNGSSRLNKYTNTSLLTHHHFHESFSKLQILGQIVISPDLLQSDSYYNACDLFLFPEVNDHWRDLYFISDSKDSIYSSSYSKPELLGDINVQFFTTLGSPFYFQIKEFKELLTNNAVKNYYRGVYDEPQGAALNKKLPKSTFLEDAEYFITSTLDNYYSP